MKQLKILSIVLLAVSIAIGGYFGVQRIRLHQDTGPVLQYDSAMKDVSIQDDDTVLLQGITATDDHDGDVSDSLIVEKISQFVGNDERLLTFAAFDSNNHVSKGTRMIHYTDYTPTVFTLRSPLLVRVGSGSFSADLQAISCLDGDISRNIKVYTDETINLGVAGTHKITFSVADSAGAVSSFDATVDVYDNTKRFIYIDLTDYLVYTKVGQRIDPNRYIKTVTYNGVSYGPEDLESEDLSLSIEEMVDYNTPGSYEILYSCQSYDGQEGFVRLIVLVTDENGRMPSQGEDHGAQQ